MNHHNMHQFKEQFKNLRSETIRKEKDDASTSSIDAAALQLELARKMNIPISSNVTNSYSRHLKQSSRPPHKKKIGTKQCHACGLIEDINSRVCNNCGCFYIMNTTGPNLTPNSNTVIPLTLAQKRGLVEVTSDMKPLDNEEWKEIEANMSLRNESICPICMSGFNTGCEVLLSCSHIFHLKCIASFERFARVPSQSKTKSSPICPICRTSNYQKRITKKGSLAFMNVCVVKIQAVGRGYVCRVAYARMLREYYNKGLGMTSNRLVFCRKEMNAYSQDIHKQIATKQKKLDTLMDSSDKVISENHELDLLFDQMLRSRMNPDVAGYGNDQNILQETTDYYNQFHEVSSGAQDVAEEDRGTSDVINGLTVKQWDDILHSALKRRLENVKSNRQSGSKDVEPPCGFQGVDELGVENEEDECAICMNSYVDSLPVELLPYTPASNFHGGNFGYVTLLNCSHMFHEQCIANFEKFTPYATKSCPMCRNSENYARRNLSQCCIGFAHGTTGKGTKKQVKSKKSANCCKKFDSYSVNPDMIDAADVKVKTNDDILGIQSALRLNCDDDFIKQQGQLLEALCAKQNEEKQSIASSNVENEKRNEHFMFNAADFASGKDSSAGTNCSTSCSKGTRNSHSFSIKYRSESNARLNMSNKNKSKTDSTSLSSMRSMYQSKSKK